MMKLSDETQRLVADGRKIAERYDNDFISTQHFNLAINKYISSQSKFRATLTELKTIIQDLKDTKQVGCAFNGNFPLTKQFEKAIQYSDFHRWMLSDKEVKPEHLLLAFIGESRTNKNLYEEYLIEQGIVLSALRRQALKFYFNPVVRAFGLIKLAKKS